MRRENKKRKSTFSCFPCSKKHIAQTNKLKWLCYKMCTPVGLVETKVVKKNGVKWSVSKWKRSKNSNSAYLLTLASPNEAVTFARLSSISGNLESLKTFYVEEYLFIL